MYCTFNLFLFFFPLSSAKENFSHMSFWQVVLVEIENLKKKKKINKKTK
jgi:hypothetical protein